MNRWLLLAGVGLVACSVGAGPADGRGFGGFRGGGGAGGFRGESGGGRSFGGESRGGAGSENFGRSGLDGFGGPHSPGGGESRSPGGWDRPPERSGSRTGEPTGGAGRPAGAASYDRPAGGSSNPARPPAGERGSVPAGRDAPASTPAGRAYPGAPERGSAPAGAYPARPYPGAPEGSAAVGPYGRPVGGSQGAAAASAARAPAEAGWQAAFAGSGHMATDVGLSHYSSFATAGVSHATAFRSVGDVSGQCGFVRGTFGYYGAFHPAWYTAHPGAWTATGWAAGAAWATPTWPAVSSFCSVPGTPVNYDFGNNVVIQGNSVNLNGQDAGTADQFAAQATALADQGQKDAAPPAEEWKALGVFALVQGEATTSDHVFQLAVNQAGVIRGNYYDGLTDTTTPVYGSVDKKSQRAAWTIGKKNDRVFDAGLSNLTAGHCPVLIHLGKDRTEQWLLVRVQQPANGN